MIEPVVGQWVLFGGTLQVSAGVYSIASVRDAMVVLRSKGGRTQAVSQKTFTEKSTPLKQPIHARTGPTLHRQKIHGTPKHDLPPIEITRKLLNSLSGNLKWWHERMSQPVSGTPAEELIYKSLPVKERDRRAWVWWSHKSGDDFDGISIKGGRYDKNDSSRWFTWSGARSTKTADLGDKLQVLQETTRDSTHWSLVPYSLRGPMYNPDPQKFGGKYCQLAGYTLLVLPPLNEMFPGIYDPANWQEVLGKRGEKMGKLIGWRYQTDTGSVDVTRSRSDQFTFSVSHAFLQSLKGYQEHDISVAEN